LRDENLGSTSADTRAIVSGAGRKSQLAGWETDCSEVGVSRLHESIDNHQRQTERYDRRPQSHEDPPKDPPACLPPWIVHRVPFSPEKPAKGFHSMSMLSDVNSPTTISR